MNLRKGDEPPALTVALSTARDRRFITYIGMNGRLPGRIREALRTVRARHVHLAFAPPRCSTWATLVKGLRRRGMTTSWDFGWNPDISRDPGFSTLIETLDCVFLNRAEALLYARQPTLAGSIRFWRRAADHVVIRLGPRGSLLVGRDRVVRVPAPRVRVVDTTGAGDAFNAGFLAAYLRGRDFESALREGNAVGARSVRRAGGIAGLPRRSRRL